MQNVLVAPFQNKAAYMTQDLKELSEQLISTAKKFGASSAEAIVACGKSLSVEVKDQSLEKIENSESIDLGLRVFVNQKSASVSVSSIKNNAIEEMALRAVAMAKEAPSDEFSGLAKSSEICVDWDLEKLKLWDDSYNNVNSLKLESLALEMEKSALEIKGISQCEGAGTGSTFSDFYMSNTNGFSGGYRRSSFQLFCSAIAGSNSSMERDYASESRVFFNDLPDGFEIGALAGERAFSKLNSQKPPTGKYPVFFDQRVSSSLIGHLTSAINGASISRGSSWLLNSLEKKVLPENLTLTEDPTRPKIFGSRPFDGEGLPTCERKFIENGVLKTFALDLRSARKLNLQATGNASRSLSSTPYPSIGNLYLSHGVMSFSDIVKSIKSGLLVTSLIGSTINQNTGDYSRGASGFWIENGAISFPVNECTIAGNLKEMLLGIVPADDGKPYLSRVIPSLLVEHMIVAGQ